MTSQTTHYFFGEGREHLRDCVRRAAEACIANRVDHLVIFTGTGEGPHFAAKEILPQEEFRNLHMVAVTPLRRLSGVSTAFAPAIHAARLSAPASVRQ